MSKTIGSNETLSSIEVGNLLRASPLSVKLLRASTKRRILGRQSNGGLNEAYPAVPGISVVAYPVDSGNSLSPLPASEWARGRY